MSEQRLNDLEAKFAHQERTIETLQELVYEQQKQLDQQQKILKRHAQRLDDLSSEGLEAPSGNEKPPHY